jgi:hypothetical protein
MSDIREILDSLSKQDLIELLIEYSDNGYFPLDLFLLKADYRFSAEDLEKYWNNAYDKALEYDRNKDDSASCLLRDCAEMCFEQAQKLEDDESKKSICDMLIDSLTAASESDGIGMYHDSEWLYIEIRDEISDFVEENF